VAPPSPALCSWEWSAGDTGKDRAAIESSSLLDEGERAEERNRKEIKNSSAF